VYLIARQARDTVRVQGPEERNKQWVFSIFTAGSLELGLLEQRLPGARIFYCGADAGGVPRVDIYIPKQTHIAPDWKAKLWLGVAWLSVAVVLLLDPADDGQLFVYPVGGRAIRAARLLRQNALVAGCRAVLLRR